MMHDSNANKSEDGECEEGDDDNDDHLKIDLDGWALDWHGLELLDNGFDV